MISSVTWLRLGFGLGFGLGWLARSTSRSVHHRFIHTTAIANNELGHLGADRRAQVHDAIAEEQRRHVGWRADPHPIDHDVATGTRRLHRHATGTHLP